MSPSEKQPSPVRQRLIEAAIAVLEQDGPEGLQARKLAAEIGASTMAVYTHFGGMPALLEEVAREGFRRFGRCLADAARSDDPVADLLAMGLAYREFARGNSQLYRLMFGLTTPGTSIGGHRDLTAEGEPTSLTEGIDAFNHLVDAIERVRDADRIRHADALAVAGQVWSTIHGFVLLEIAGFFGDDGEGLLQVLGPLIANLLVGLGDGRDAVERSTRSAVARVAAPGLDAFPDRDGGDHQSGDRVGP